MAAQVIDHLMDGVEPGIIGRAEHAARAFPGVLSNELYCTRLAPTPGGGHR